MISSTHVGALRQDVDPFGERQPTSSLTVRVLGAEFEFTATDKRLLGLVKRAYEGLPRQAFMARPGRFKIALRLAQGEAVVSKREVPAAMKLHSGAGMLCGVVDANNFAVVAPEQRAATVCISRAMLAHPYHARYELIEFAVYVLAARSQALLPLHAACVSYRGKGVLLIGASGTGKSTLALHCIRSGMEFVAEDSVLVRPSDLRATGIGAFLHLRVDGRHFLPETPRWIRDAPVIRRRSGIRKFEIDVRTTPFKMSNAAPRIRSVVFLSSQSTSGFNKDLLKPLSRAQSNRRLRSTQAYSAGQPGWRRFSSEAGALSSYVLYRGDHPAQQVAAIKSLLSH